MKTLAAAFITLVVTALSAFAQKAPPVGSISDNQTFAVRSGAAFNSVNLDDYEGSILVLMMMTPWCPFCQGNTIAVGDGILDHFFASGRGALRGKNNQGVVIRSLLLSTEPASDWDTTNASFSAANGFQRWGLDARPNRGSPRALLGYYRGGFIPGTNLYDWGDDRRRLVVLNLVRGSASHEYREIVINQNFFTSSGAPAARAAINAIQNSTGPLESEEQTIAFNLPASAALGDAPLRLSATASSGLPVVFTLVSGPATLVGRNLTFTGAGDVTVRASQPGDATFESAPVVERVITVVGFGGEYEALLLDLDSVPVGKLTLTIPRRALSYTGKLYLSDEARALSVSSSSRSPGTTLFRPMAEAAEETGEAEEADASATWTRVVEGADALALDLSVSAAGSLVGSLERNGEVFATLAHGARRSRPARGESAWGHGAYTLALHAPARGIEDESTSETARPGGGGFATARIAPGSGVLALRGFVADGSRFSASLRASGDARYLLWANPYGSRLGSALAGALALETHPEAERFPGRAYVSREVGALFWSKAALPVTTPIARQDTSYRAGFGPLELPFSLDPWLSPSRKAAISLVQRLGLSVDAGGLGELGITYGPGTLDLGESGALLPSVAELSPSGVLTAVNSAATAWTIRITPSTGAFTGGFTLSDQVAPAPARATERRVVFSGVFRQAPGNEDEVAAGFFLVPGFPVPRGTLPAEQTSGELRVFKSFVVE